MKNVFRILAGATLCLLISCEKEHKGPTDFSNGCEAVDLGLSVKWASYNLGTYSMYGLDSFYAWGETQEKKYYDWAKEGEYRWGVYDVALRPSYGMSGYLGNIEGGDKRTVLEEEDDPSTVVWGTKWRTPTREEFNELLDRTKCEWTWDINKRGFTIKGYKTGKSIFLPVTGYGNGSSLHGEEEGRYWSSTVNGSQPWGAYSLDFSIYGGAALLVTSQRRYGLAVRPVTDY